MIKKLLFFCVLIFLVSGYDKHEYYIGLTEITYNEDEERLEIISRLFIDDLEKVLKERYNSEIILNTKEQSGNIDFYISKYFDRKLKLSILNNELDLKYIGYKFEKDRINIFLKIDQIKIFNELKVSNLLLTDVFEDQSNIVHCFKLNQKKSVLLTRYKSEALLNFKD